MGVWRPTAAIWIFSAVGSGTRYAKLEARFCLARASESENWVVGLVNSKKIPFCVVPVCIAGTTVREVAGTGERRD